MDIKAEMLKLISISKRRIIVDHDTMHDYKSISEKKQKNLLKIDPYFNREEFVAM